MLSRSIKNIIRRVESRELTPDQAKELIALELRFEMKKNLNAKRSSTNLFL